MDQQPQHQQKPALTDPFEVGLDRAKITKSRQIQLPEPHAAEKQSTDSDAESDSPHSSSHNVVDSIKLKKHKAGVRIRKKLHIGRASDDYDLTTVAIVGENGESDSRYITKPPEPERPTFKDFVHNPIDTVRTKVSEHSDKQFAGQVSAKEVPHGDEVDLLHASEAVEAADTDAQRLLAIQDLSKLMKERQATFARWTLDRHVTKVRPLPRDEIKLKSRSEFERYNPQEGLVIDWRAYGEHLLFYYAHQYGGQYIGYGSDLPAPSKHTIMPNIERFLIASSPLQEFIMTSRRVYRWEHPPTTAKYLLIYSVLWYFNMLLPGCLAFFIYLVVERRTHGNTMEDMREDIKHRENQRTTALSLTELIVKEGDRNWSQDLLDGLGPWFMIQLADLANFFESMRNFYEWRVPHRTMRITIFLGVATLATALIPMWLLVKSMTFAMGVTYFALYPIAVNFPEYRLLVSPTKRLLWNIPTHAEWAIKYVQAEGVRLAEKSKPVASSPAQLSPTFDPAHDYNSYTAHHDKTTGRLIVSAGGVRFVSNMGFHVPWSLRYDELQKFEKEDRIVQKNVPNKLQWDSGQDLKFVCKNGREFVLKQVQNRNEAFSQIVGFSNINWQVICSLHEQEAAHEIEQRNDEVAKRVLRKIDWRLIPLMFITYNLNFMDKTILSSASVFGLREDTHLQGQQYSWVSSVFYFGYFFWEYPTTFLIARLPVAKYLAANTFVWGAVVALTAACTNYGGLVTLRFFLGVAEATITPAFLFITSTWYTRDEIPTRTGLWFAGNSVGGLVASFLAYGVGHIEGSLAPWIWMYIILGSLTFVWGIPMLLFLPDSISKAKFLTEDEREAAARRVALAGTGSTDNTRWKLNQALECLRDPKTWIIFSMSLLTQIPNGGTQNFGNLVIKSFGFTSLQSTLLVIPASIIAAATIAGTGYLAGRFRQLNCILIILVVVPAVVGSSLIYARPRTSSGVQLLGYFLLSTGPGAIPLLMSLVGANYKGVTKKMTMTALLFIAYCAGNIAGPQFFRTTEAPHYNTAFRAILVCYCLVIGLAVVLRCYLQWVNGKREREEGVKGDAGSAGVLAGKMADERERSTVVVEADLRAEGVDDVTDWETFGFRYRL
ncbi:major facilitator superfamily transporter [Stagonosporopsis vannaccii]|nr:major facilitator superfamily transporter [Stagonosporopsis vannaccii]